MQIWAAIAAGGALGALARYFFMGQAAGLLGTGFPFATLVVNVLGAFLMGVLVELFALFWSPGGVVQAFFTIGILGSFTTFSAFSLDLFGQLQRGDYLAAFLYALLSVGLCLGGLLFGLYSVRSLAT